MINIRLIIYSLIEPEFKEVGWLHRINNILVLSFYNNGIWENISILNTSIEELRGIIKSIGLDPTTLVYSNEGNYIGKLQINTVASDIKALDSLVKSTEVNIASDFNIFNKRIETAESTIILQADLISTKVELESFNELNNRVSKAESDIVQNANAIKLKVSQTDFNDLGERVTNAESTITLLADLIATKVSLDDFNNLGIRVSNAESRIIQTAKDITSKVSQTDFNELGQRVGTAESMIIQNADAIKTKVSQTTFDALGQRVSTAESSITQNATAITTKVSQTDFDALGLKVSTAESSIKQNADSISTKVSQTDFNELGQRVSTAETNITENANSISAQATNINNLTGRVSTAEAKITPEAINLTVKSQIDRSYDNAINAAATSASKLYVSSILHQQDIASLQSQIDGGIETWFYEYIPTSDNAPTNTWVTDEVRNTHLGDLFYNTLTRYCYRYQLSDSVYSWAVVADTDVTKALANAAAAQDTADHKRRIFVTTPIVPYDVGDMWAQGSNGDILVCETAKIVGQDYNASDWVSAAKYTDDTLASEAKSDAEAAQSDATNALNNIASIISDNILDSSEKPSQRLAWNTISAEKANIDSNADIFGVSRTDYDNAFQTLANYLNSGITYTTGIPTWLSDINLSSNTIIVGSTYRTNWENYYTERTLLLNSIALKTKTFADSAQNTANAAQTTANTAANAASTAQTNATSALETVSNIISDNILSPIEKSAERKEWNTIYAEKSNIDNLADTFGISRATYDDTFKSLASYLNAGVIWSEGVPNWLLDANLSSNTTIDGTTYRQLWSTFYTARTTLLNLIAEKARTLANSAQTTADSAAQELSEYQLAMITTINGLQSQIDGEVDSWFFQVDPTISNDPASGWTTDILKQHHANDTYTNINTGDSWRWTQTNNVWGWTPIANTTAQNALINAAKAQDTADGKRRVFTAQPTDASVYDIGDVWVNATYGTYKNDFLVCIIAKSTGAAFNIAHWQVASRYTDDTAANAAQLVANTAADSATKALNHITDLVSDNILSAAEKPAQFTEWQQAVFDKSLYDSEAITYNISTEKTDYDNAFIALANYLNGDTTWTSDTTPLWFQDLSTNTTIVGDTYRNTWLSYYEKRGILLNKITAQAKAIAESNAAKDATNKTNNAIGSSKTYTDSQFKVASDLISSKVSQTDFNSLGIRVGAAESNITLNANSIATKVSQMDFNALGQRVGAAESDITQNATDIGLKVSKDGVIGAINLTSEAATINASKINLVGAVTANSIVAGAVTTEKLYAGAVTADKIAANTITGDQINATSVSASIATVISLDAGRITTGVLSADRIDAVSVVTKGLVAQKVQAATLQTIHNSGEAYVAIHNGIIDVYGTVARNIQFGVNDQGMAVLKYFNNDGINLYDLGPNGIDSKNLQSAQWEEIQYVRVLSIMQTVPQDGLVSYELASVLFRLNTTWDLTTLYRYHAGKINGTIVSDSSNGFTTAAAAAAADGKLFTVKSSGHLANDTYTNNNGSHMITDIDSNEVDKKYMVIQNGVLTSYFWQCPLETFNMINGID